MPDRYKLYLVAQFVGPAAGVPGWVSTDCRFSAWVLLPT